MVVSISVTDGLAWVEIDNPPVNATSQAVRQGVLEAVAQCDADREVRAVVLVCAGRTFVAGADVTEFGKPPRPPHLPDVIDAIEAAAKPWVAALHGTVLGGGLELAMGCHARIAAPGTKLGLPEVGLGLIPGAGGTLRLPRLVPATTALSMIAGGKPVSASQALQDGLIDALAADDLRAEAAALAQTVQLRRTLDLRCKAYDLSTYDSVKTKTLTRARGQLSIPAAIEAVDRALTLPVAEARTTERAAFLALKDSDQSAALRHIFFAERKTLGDPRCKGTPRPLDHVAVIGGGTMGAGIATACLMRGLQVTLLEQTSQAADTARTRIAETLGQSHKRGLIPDATALMQALATDTDYAALAKADLVIEAVFEDLSVKQEVFRAIEAATRPDTIIATNTSYLDVNAIAATLENPSRAIGLHFFSPAHIMKLLEIVLPSGVADDVVATAALLGKKLGKIGVLAGVCDGFIGNRIMSAYRHEADLLLLDGADPAQVDAAMRDFGFPMGVFEMQDMAGLDIGWAMRKRRIAEQGLPEDYVHIADQLCEAGRFGRKTGAGWYAHGENGAKASEFVARIIADERARLGRMARDLSLDEIMARILSRMQREARAVEAEGIARTGADIDVVMVNGYGFPRWRGGPCFST